MPITILSSMELMGKKVVKIADKLALNAPKRYTHYAPGSSCSLYKASQDCRACTCECAARVVEVLSMANCFSFFYLRFLLQPSFLFLCLLRSVKNSYAEQDKEAEGQSSHSHSHIGLKILD
ncbi:hypothetical protein Pint_12557 [Pistacia integerrima]|uniref:Uncharacterized protein n=1 Tax=Pistacia integerrima TaxID=434235 RepID=A0ACC0Y9I4_9ROSI|nr:hypothetical protein Pint_12557 [Pistacia integerrima]